jgi:hypothetical protein
MSAHEIHAIALCHASQHTQYDLFTSTLTRRDRANAAHCFLFSQFPHRARVVKNDLRARVFFHHLIAERSQLAANKLAIKLIHLASEGL